MFRITALHLQNYKSLRSIRLAPGMLTVLVGPNASGKSNLADSLDFISELYRHGLEVAVARKGGYENIAHRKQRRSKGAIVIDITAEYTTTPRRVLAGRRKSAQAFHFQVRHKFSFATKGSAISAEFNVGTELIDVSIRVEGTWTRLSTITRRGTAIEVIKHLEDVSAAMLPSLDKTTQENFLGMRDLDLVVSPDGSVFASATELVAVTLGRFLGPLRTFVSSMADIRVFQIAPGPARQFGAPTPNAELGASGANLPSVIDLLQKREPETWAQIMQSMNRFLPELESVRVGYTTGRTLGLFFHERGVGRPWSVEEVSDGTIRMLALLAAIHDPRSSALVIEEPENSVHSWIIRNTVESCIEASRSRQILLTTHSPIVMNAVSPNDVWIIWRHHGESHIRPLNRLGHEARHAWEQGEVSTFDYLDSGAVQEALPFPSLGQRPELEPEE